MSMEDQIFQGLMGLGPWGIIGATAFFVGKSYIATVHGKLDKLTDMVGELREDMARLKGKLGE